MPTLKTVLLILALLAGLWALDRVGLWAERRGWIFWRRRKAAGNALGSATLELQKIFESGKAAHVIEAKHDPDKESGDPGAGPGVFLREARRDMTVKPEIREIRPEESGALGQLLVAVYSALEGFPTPAEQPGYYAMLANIGQFSERPGAKVLVAVSAEGQLMGGVVYFGDMAQYGSGGAATAATHASGIRLLGVDARFRGLGVGRALTGACIQRAKDEGHAEVILHTTEAMRIAWGLYERLGFDRSPDLDFIQGALPVFGFRLSLGR